MRTCFSCGARLGPAGPCSICENRKNAARIEASNKSVADEIRSAKAAEDRRRDEERREREEERREAREAARAIAQSMFFNSVKNQVPQWKERYGDGWFVGNFIRLVLGLGPSTGRQNDWMEFLIVAVGRDLEPRAQTLLRTYPELVALIGQGHELKGAWVDEAKSQHAANRKNEETKWSWIMLLITLGVTALFWMGVDWHWLLKGFAALILFSVVGITAGLNLHFFVDALGTGDMSPGDEEAFKTKERQMVLLFKEVLIRSEEGADFKRNVLDADKDYLIDSTFESWAQAPFVFSPDLGEELRLVTQRIELIKNELPKIWTYGSQAPGTTPDTSPIQMEEPIVQVTPTGSAPAFRAPDMVPTAFDTTQDSVQAAPVVQTSPAAPVQPSRTSSGQMQTVYATVPTPGAVVPSGRGPIWIGAGLAAMAAAVAAYAILPSLRGEPAAPAPTRVASSAATAPAPAAPAPQVTARTTEVAAASSPEPVAPARALPALGKLLSAFAIDFDKSHSANGWDALDGLNEVKWAWPVSQVGMKDYTMQGVIPKAAHQLPGVGDVSVKIGGARTMMFTLALENESEGSISMDALGATAVQEIVSTCTENGATFSLKTYRATFSGKRPVYLNHMVSVGASGSIESLTLHQSQQEALSAKGDNCKPS